jgi:N-acetylglucosamine-6-phosphate deacetylase
LTPTLIADLVHVHPVMMRLVVARKQHVALVSDAVATVGVREEGGAARLPDGTLAGAVVLLDTAVRNVVHEGVPLTRAAAMASCVPGRVLGLDTFGARGLGGCADLVALDTTTLAVRGVWIDGVQLRGPEVWSPTA